jgi:hypothetical protein
MSATRSGQVPRKWTFRLLTLALLFTPIAGCKTLGMRPEPFTTEQIVEMSRAKVPAEEIIRKIRESRTVYPLHAGDVKRLLDEGVDERVVDEMLQTRLREMRDYYGYPYYYPPPYYGPRIGFGYAFHP